MTDEAALFQLTGVGVVQTDLATGHLVRTNAAFCDMVGHSQAELRGMTYTELTHPDDRERDAASFTALHRGESRGGSSLTRVLREDGRVAWLELHVTVIQDDTGKGYAIAVAHDVTARLRAEEALKELNDTLERRVEARTEALRQSEERAQRAFDASPMPFTVSRLDDGAVLAINDSALAAFGFTREQVVGRRMSELGVRSELLSQREAFARQLRERRSLRDVEVSLTLPSGETLHTVSAYEVVESNGEELLLSMFLDVTERRRTQEQMHRAIQEVMSDTDWFSHRVMERLAHIRTGGTEMPLPVEFSKRERQVLERLAQGMNNKAIARDLELSVHTVRNYTANLYDKINVHSRAEAIVWARERGII